MAETPGDLDFLTQFNRALRSSDFELREADIADPARDVPERIDGVPIPEGLRRLYYDAFGCVRLTYYRELSRKERAAFGSTCESHLYGGPVIVPATDLPALKIWADEWTDGFRDDPAEFALWRRGVPFTYTMNGDFVAFDEGGRVLYLSHEGDSFVLADDFETFWQVWKSVYFLGPEHWTLEPFRGSDDRLDPALPAIAKFRQAFEGLLYGEGARSGSPGTAAEDLWNPAPERCIPDPTQPPETVTVQAQVDAPVERVWEAWTDTAAILQWYGESDDRHCLSAHIDLRTGGSYVYRTAARDGSATIDLFGTFLEVDPPRSLVSRLSEGAPMGGGRQIRATFASTDGGTAVTQTLEIEPTQPVDQQRAGWQSVLDRFKTYVESTADS